MNKTPGIYGFLNTITGKWYVGQSVHIERRKAYHLWFLKSGRHYNSHFQSAFEKNGATAIEFRILEVVRADMLDVRERAWIAYYRSDQSQHGYNYESGGVLGKTSSQEANEKRSLAQKGKKKTDIHRQRISAALKGKVSPLKGTTMPEAQREKIAQAHRGKPKTAEHCRNLSLAKIGRSGFIPSAQTNLKRSLSLKAFYARRTGSPSIPLDPQYAPPSQS